MLRVAWRLQVGAAWAAAPAQVVLSGAAGPDAGFVNGRFELVEREVHRDVVAPDTWLYVAKAGWIATVDYVS